MSHGENKWLGFGLFLLASASLHLCLIFALQKPDPSKAAERPDVISVVHIIDRPMPTPEVIVQLSSLSEQSKKPSLAKLSNQLAEPLVIYSTVDGRAQRLPIMEVRELSSIGFDHLVTPRTEIGFAITNATYKNAEQLDRRARAKKDLIAAYPRQAYDDGLQGIVTIEILINPVGEMDSSRIIESTSGFENSAMKALEGMTFFPAEASGEKVASRLLIQMSYQLIDPSSGLASTENLLEIESFTTEEMSN